MAVYLFAVSQFNIFSPPFNTLALTPSPSLSPTCGLKDRSQFGDTNIHINNNKERCFFRLRICNFGELGLLLVLLSMLLV